MAICPSLVSHTPCPTLPWCFHCIFLTASRGKGLSISVLGVFAVDWPVLRNPAGGCGGLVMRRPGWRARGTPRVPTVFSAGRAAPPDTSGVLQRWRPGRCLNKGVSKQGPRMGPEMPCSPVTLLSGRLGEWISPTFQVTPPKNPGLCSFSREPMTSWWPLQLLCCGGQSCCAFPGLASNYCSQCQLPCCLSSSGCGPGH
jgi:hypothetical protein